MSKLSILIPDSIYLRLKYKKIMGKKLNLKNPITFNEKLQWLKLHDRNSEYTTMVDKYSAKKWVADRIGEEYIIPTLGVWEHFDDIDFDKLPNQFVLKCTHDSGGLVIVKDKTKFDKVSAKQKIDKCLKRNFYWEGREWPYKNVPPRIIAEKYMTDESGIELKDYKIFNFDGEPKLIQVDYNRFVEHKRNLYNTDWQYIEAAINYPTDPNHQISRPKQLEKMLELARKLSEGIPHVRTDFYCIDDRIYFGELTLYHGSGFEKFDPESLGEEMGKWLKLPQGGYMLISDFAIFVLREEISAVNEELKDYKIFCFNGKARYIEVDFNRFVDHKLNTYDFDWKPLNFCDKSKSDYSANIKKPTRLSDMKQIAEKLSEGIKLLRVDFYSIYDKIYVGELTLYPGSGFIQFDPPETDLNLGKILDLEDK